jgi:hypothetical protein
MSDLFRELARPVSKVRQRHRDVRVCLRDLVGRASRKLAVVTPASNAPVPVAFVVALHVHVKRADGARVFGSETHDLFHLLAARAVAMVAIKFIHVDVPVAIVSVVGQRESVSVASAARGFSDGDFKPNRLAVDVSTQAH